MPDAEESRSGGGWWSRVRQALHARSREPSFESITLADDVVHASKAVRRLLDLLGAQTAPVLLDLGPVIGPNIAFLGEHLGCKVHIEDVFGDVDRLERSGKGAGVAAFLSTRLSQEPESVDAVLAWDLFDYLEPAEGSALVRRLVRVLRPGGLVMACFTTAFIDSPSYRKYIIEDADHLRHRRLPFARPVSRVWLGRDVERFFAPLEVAETYLLTHLQRETLLRRPTGAGRVR